MNCQDRIRLLQAYVDGELDVVASLDLEDHVQACARCRAVLDKASALRKALRGNVPPEPMPQSLRRRLESRFSSAPPAETPAWRWRAAASAPGVMALLLVVWLGFLAPDSRKPSAVAGTRIVYHISSSANADAALRNLGNHLSADPGVRVVVVAHNEGIDFLLRGAQDAGGRPYEAAVNRFRERGVDFRVCRNTLERRSIGNGEVIPAAVLVPSGMAEIGRLQGEEGYAYMRL